MRFRLHYIMCIYPRIKSMFLKSTEQSQITDHHRKAKIITFLLSPHCHSSLLPISSNCSYNFISFGR